MTEPAAVQHALKHMPWLTLKMNYITLHSPQLLQNLNQDEIVRLSSGILLTGSKNFYDKLNTDTPIIKGAERRADLEALTVKESMETTSLMLRWVHSDAQLANSNTKPSDKHQAHLFRRLHQRWRLIYDPNMTSAKRRKTLGLNLMAHPRWMTNDFVCDFV